MPFIYIAIIIFLIEVLQTSVFNYLTILGVKPDLLLIFIVYLGIHQGSLTGEIAGFCGGLLQDLLTLSSMGVNSLTKTTLGFIGGFLQKKIEEDNIILCGILIFLASLINGLIVNIVQLIFLNTLFLPNDIWSIFIVSIYNAVLAPVLFWFFRKIKII